MSEETLRGPLYIDRNSRRLYEVASMDSAHQSTIIDSVTSRKLKNGDYLIDYDFHHRLRDREEYLGGSNNTAGFPDYSQLPFCNHLFHRVHND